MTYLLFHDTSILLQVSGTIPSGNQLRNAILLVATGVLFAAIPNLVSALWQEKSRREAETRQIEREIKTEERQAKREAERELRDEEREVRREQRASKLESEARRSEMRRSLILDFQRNMMRFQAGFDNFHLVVTHPQAAVSLGILGTAGTDLKWRTDIDDALNAALSAGTLIGDKTLLKCVVDCKLSYGTVARSKDAEEREKIRLDTMLSVTKALGHSGELYRETLKGTVEP